MSYKNRTAAKILYTLIYIMCMDKYIYTDNNGGRDYDHHIDLKKTKEEEK